MAGQYDIEGRRGNTLRLTFRFKTDADTVLDLSGSEIIFRAIYFGGVIRKSSASAQLTLNEAEGEVLLVLTAAETRALPAGSLTSYEIERRVTGDETTLVSGQINLSEGVNDDV